jgi:hypothetical protein
MIQLDGLLSYIGKNQMHFRRGGQKVRLANLERQDNKGTCKT